MFHIIWMFDFIDYVRKDAQLFLQRNNLDENANVFVLFNEKCMPFEIRARLDKPTIPYLVAFNFATDEHYFSVYDLMLKDVKTQPYGDYAFEDVDNLEKHIEASIYWEQFDSRMDVDYFYERGLDIKREHEDWRYRFEEVKRNR